MLSRHSGTRSLPFLLNATLPAIAAVMLVVAFAAGAQSTGMQPATAGQPAAAGQQPAAAGQPATGRTAQASKPKPHGGSWNAPDAKPIQEEELRRRLQGKMLYLRGAYSGDDLHFDIHGSLEGSSPKTSYTLNMVQVQKVRLSKHKLDIEGIRYGIHFLGAVPGEDPMVASDRVRITPKKKFLRISIARPEVVKKKKRSKDEPVEPESQSMSQAMSNRLLNEALDRVFSANMDEKMIASLPDYWQLYYRALAAKSNYKPSDPAVLRQNMVDQKARLLTGFESPSNDFAQQAGVAGVAEYHVVVGRDGKAGEIAISRPIGFGLDENAVSSIRRATFQPAMKGGQTVPVVLDLMVEFRIYSKRTGASEGSEAASATVRETQGPSLPGPYSANEPAPTGQP